MRRNLVILGLILSLLMLGNVVWAANDSGQAVSTVQGNITYIETSRDLPTGPIPGEKTLELGQKQLAVLELNTDIFGKDYTFVMRGSYNGWDYNDEWEAISSKDVRLTEKAGKLIIDFDRIIAAAKLSDNTANWDDAVSIVYFDKNGNFAGNVLQDIPINGLTSKQFKPVSDAVITVLSTQKEFRANSAGKYSAELGTGKECLRVSGEGFADEIIYLDAKGKKQIERNVLLQKPAFNLGERYRVHNIYSEKLGNMRNLVVYLPPSYQTDKSKRYPVLYMHDGQNLFDVSTSGVSAEWKVDEAITKLVAEGKIKEIIVVGIFNTAQRTADYTHIQDPTSPYGIGGNGAAYGDLLANEIKPFIDASYRTLEDRDNTAVMGASFGGLVSLSIGYQYPDKFGMIGAMSTSVWWANREIINRIDGKRGIRFKKVWVDVGTDEDPDGEMLAGARLLKDFFLNQGYKLGADFGYYEDEGAAHNEDAWARRMPMALTLFFGIDK